MRPSFSLPFARWLAPPVVGAIAVIAGSTVALASTLTAGSVVRVPDNPLGGGATCAALVAQQEALGSKNFPDAEVEPYTSVDPTNPMHLIGSVQQDRWNDGGSNGLTNVVSTDGGATWSLAAGQPQFSVCAGAQSGSAGFFNRATDPWTSFSADGKVAYSISDSFNANGPGFGGASSIVVSRSTDGGSHWQAPVTARLDTSVNVLNDKESVTGDPVIANNAYAVWDQLVSPSVNANPSAFLHSIAFRGPTFFSRTTDKGVSWSNGRVIFDPGQNDQTIGNQIVVPTAGQAAGVLIDGMSLITNQGGKCPFKSAGKCGKGSTFTSAIIRSTDGGNTWSDAIPIDVQQVGHVAIAGHRVRSSDELPEFAVNPINGTLYSVWQDSRFTGTSKIAFAQSTDGGLTWSNTIRIDQSPGSTPAFVPQIDVAADGTVGLIYYDLENATAAKPGLTDAFIAHCHSATSDCSSAASWTSGGETRLSTSGSFDYTTAPNANGLFLGDYDGLTSSAGTFRAFFCMSRPIATAGASDLFFNTAK
ncbi:MAG TPA: sialidase family protein [Terriglobales bacterium]|nr:sialidase family protein [Terriglobales bacterium]